MSDLEVRQFEANFAAFRAEQGAGLSDSKAFERYIAEQVLKDYDLSNEEIESGDLSVGAMMVKSTSSTYFMHHQLITLVTAAPIPAGHIELHFDPG
jgi:hypothetical protein